MASTTSATAAVTASSADLQLALRDNLFIRQPVPKKGIVCSNQERARRLAAEYLVQETVTTFACSWGAQVWIGHYVKNSTQQIFVAIAPVRSGSGLVFQELYSAGCEYLVRYGSDDCKDPDPTEYHSIKLVDVTDNLVGFCQASGLPESEWGAAVPASPVLVKAFEDEANARQLTVQRRICHHLENYHSLRNPQVYPGRVDNLNQQLAKLSAQTPPGLKESFDMESAVLFRVAKDSHKHAVSILQTVNKEAPGDCDPYEGKLRQEALAKERGLFVDYIFSGLLRVSADDE